MKRGIILTAVRVLCAVVLLAQVALLLGATVLVWRWAL